MYMLWEDNVISVHQTILHTQIELSLLLNRKTLATLHQIEEM
jgi:hypothetical protein